MSATIWKHVLQIPGSAFVCPFVLGGGGGKMFSELVFTHTKELERATAIKSGLGPSPKICTIITDFVLWKNKKGEEVAEQSGKAALSNGSNSFPFLLFPRSLLGWCAKIKPTMPAN